MEAGVYNTMLFLLQSGGNLGFILPMVLIFAIMYFLIFRPQAKKQKKHQAMVESLKKGDKIITSGGIYGTISGIKEKEKSLLLKIDDNVKIEISRASVASVLGKDNGGS